MSEKQESSKQPKERKGSFWYFMARVGAAIVFHTLGPVRYHGRENLMEQGPCIMIGNHSSWMDPVIMAAPVRKTDITFLGKKELVKSKLAHHILTNMHMIIVDRHNSDMEAMRACTRALKEGEMLGIFPEGTRHHEGLMTELESGVALIALRANVPLIPVYITPKYRLFQVTHCYVGQPIDFADLRAEGVNKETCQKLLDRITETYATMARDAVQKKV